MTSVYVYACVYVCVCVGGGYPNCSLALARSLMACLDPLSCDILGPGDERCDINR